jgi:protein-tyrosine-phosphatase
VETLSATPAEPAFLKLLAHELRWNILTLLARSDYRGLEIVQRLKQPQNLISYHLRLLATNHLVSERRSTADGRDIYYSLDLDRLREGYAAAATALHPGLLPAHPFLPASPPFQISPPVRVLFLCTENSARSQMAEGLLRHLAGDAIEVYSAGSQPTEIHPSAIRVLAHMGVDISQQHSKHVELFRDQSFDTIVTVCDRMREECPTFPDTHELIHWSFPDPAAGEYRSEEEADAAFALIAQQLVTRLRHLLVLLAAEHQQMARTA